MKIKTNHRYWTLATTLILMALALGGLALASALQVPAVESLAGLLDARPNDVDYIIIAGGALAGLALLLYLLALSPFRRSRPLALVFLNLWAPFLYLGLALAAWERAGMMEFSTYALAAAPAVALLPPLALLALEALVFRALRALGRRAQEHDWDGAALGFLKTALRLRPADAETRRRCGLLYVASDDCARALPLLETEGGSPETIDDEEHLKGLEHCYRAHRRQADALACLRRLSALRPGQPALDRRILDDLVQLERHQEALDLLESGRLKTTLETLQLSHRLNVELGNDAQSIALIRRIADEEGSPYPVATRLYRKMLARQPDNDELRINLGMLLLESENDEQRHEGAGLIETILARDPNRPHLSRLLIQFYTEAGRPQPARKHLRRLVEAGDPDPEYHLAYAQGLLEEEQFDEAARVLRSVTDKWPQDWRGYLALTRALIRLGELDEAEATLHRTEVLAPAEAMTMVDGTRANLEQRRRERYVAAMSEETTRAGLDVRKRLDLIAQQIQMEWFEKALGECDRLLSEDPGQLAAVTELIERSIEKMPRSYSLRGYLADIFYEQGRYDDALRLFREMAEQSLHPAQVLTEGCQLILERAPDHLDARRELAFARRSEQDWPGVTEALTPPIENETPLAPEDKALWVEAAYRQWHLDDAARIGLTLVDALAEETGFMIMMIDILQDMADFDGALEVFKKAKAANPRDERLMRIENKVVTTRARTRLAQLQRKQQDDGELLPAEHYETAELHRALGELDEAIVHYQRATYDEHWMPLATAKLADTLCERGMYDLADETLDSLELTRALAAEHPDLKGFIYRVGRALEKIRRFDKAVKYYKRVFRVDASYEDVVERIERLS